MGISRDHRGTPGDDRVNPRPRRQSAMIGMLALAAAVLALVTYGRRRWDRHLRRRPTLGDGGSAGHDPTPGRPRPHLPRNCRPIAPGPVGPVPPTQPGSLLPLHQRHPRRGLTGPAQRGRTRHPGSRQCARGLGHQLRTVESGHRCPARTSPVGRGRLHLGPGRPSVRITLRPLLHRAGQGILTARGVHRRRRRIFSHRPVPARPCAVHLSDQTRVARSTRGCSPTGMAPTGCCGNPTRTSAAHPFPPSCGRSPFRLTGST